MSRQQAMPYAELDESSTDDESFENCHLRIAMEPSSEKVSKSKVWRSSRKGQPKTSLNVFHRHARHTEPHQPLLVLDPAALQDEARLTPFAGTLNIDNSEVHVGPGITTINNTIYEPVMEEIPPSCLRKTTVFERVSFSIISLLILFCTGLGIYYLILSEVIDDQLYDPKTFYVSRAKWMASPVIPHNNISFRKQYQPAQLVIIQNSVTTACHNYVACCEAMRLEQRIKLSINEDTPYNFFIGNDGLVYEGMGWLYQGTHSEQFDPCVISIGFIGDYREEILGHDTVTELQINRTLTLLDYGVKKSYFRPDYRILAAKDYKDTSSPGSNLYNVIKTWEHYDSDLEYSTLTCELIYGLKFTDEAPHEWRISRNMWEAKPFNNTEWSPIVRPVRLIIIQNSVTSECHYFSICKIKLQKLQNYFNYQNEDIPYNFIVGNDGRIYESRGWAVQDIANKQYKTCAVSISFLGNYDEESLRPTKLTKAQMNRTLLLLDEGLKDGHLHQDFVIVGAKDLILTESPGSQLYRAIQQLKRYDDKRYFNKTCEEIQIQKNN